MTRRKLPVNCRALLPLAYYSMNTGNSSLFDKKKHRNIRHFHLIFFIV